MLLLQEPVWAHGGARRASLCAHMLSVHVPAFFPELFLCMFPVVRALYLLSVGLLQILCTPVHGEPYRWTPRKLLFPAPENPEAESSSLSLLPSDPLPPLLSQAPGPESSHGGQP